MDLGIYIPQSVPRERLPILLATFIGAYFLFVVLDIASGPALTTYDNVPKTVVVLAVAVVVLALTSLAYRRLGPR